MLKLDEERTRLSTTLNKEEMRDFRKAKKYVFAYCGKVSDAEVLRFLVRNWPDIAFQMGWN